jgi:hypothetical protein
MALFEGRGRRDINSYAALWIDHPLLPCCLAGTQVPHSTCVGCRLLPSLGDIYFVGLVGTQFKIIWILNMNDNYWSANLDASKILITLVLSAFMKNQERQKRGSDITNAESCLSCVTLFNSNFFSILREMIPYLFVCFRWLLSPPMYLILSTPEHYVCHVA